MTATTRVHTALVLVLAVVAGVLLAATAAGLFRSASGDGLGGGGSRLAVTRRDARLAGVVAPRG